MNNYADTDVRGFSDDEVIDLNRQADAIVNDIFAETGRSYDLQVFVEDEYSYTVAAWDFNVPAGQLAPQWDYPDLDTAERELKIIAGYPA